MPRMTKPQRVDPATLPALSGYPSLRSVFEGLDRYRVVARTHGYPENIVRLWAPVDAVHEAIVASVTHAMESVICSMYSWNDAEINSLFLTKLEDEQIFVQLSLDATQAMGRSTVPLIREWGDKVGNSLSIGHSAYGGISHIKEFVLDGVLTIGGSTNLSAGGEGFAPGGKGAQNNECYFLWDPVYAAETRARLDIIHDQQLQQMAVHQQKLMINWAEKKVQLTADERAKLRAGLVPD